MQETTTIAINFNDRFGRRIVFVLNNDQKCVVASWEDSQPTKYDKEITNTDFYRLLTSEETHHPR